MTTKKTDIIVEMLLLYIFGNTQFSLAMNRVHNKDISKLELFICMNRFWMLFFFFLSFFISLFIFSIYKILQQEEQKLSKQSVRKRSSQQEMHVLTNFSIIFFIFRLKTSTNFILFFF